MHRKHCEITDKNEMIRIMSLTNIGRMATIDENGYPYLTPVNFVYHEGCIYFHCALKGEKLDNIARNDRVGFEVDVPLAYYEAKFTPDGGPCNTHQFYHSVVIRGTARLLEDSPLKVAALNALVAKHEGNNDVPSVTADMPNYKAAAVVEIKPLTMTGKADLAQNKAPETRRQVAENLASRGLPGDRAAVRDMGFELEGSAESGWRVK